MPQQKPRPSTANARANEALDRAAPEGKTPARRTLDFLLKGSHDELGVPNEAAPERTPPTPRTPPTDATHPTLDPIAKTSPVAPERDFTRVPNSVVRDVVPGGHFTGKSKQLYDYLYQRTRGAIVPARSLKISKPALMRGCDIGSERTLLKNLGHLKELGLVKVDYTDGKHEGNSYEVFTPEEAGLHTPRTPPTPPTAGTPRHARSEVPPVPPVESGVRGVGSTLLESTTSSDAKTSFKTNTERSDDDEAFARLRLAMKEATGREVSLSTLAELDELLAIEFKIAASRTTVSSAPAFLAEHLRRRLFKKDKLQIEREAAEPRPAPSAAIDKTKCPDCGGSGYFYPEGYDKGVARCDHKKLQAEGTQ